VGATCPACGGAQLRPWRAATASDPQLTGRAQFDLERCRRCGSARTVGHGIDQAALYEGGTYAAARRPMAPILAPLRRLADRDRARLLAAMPAGGRVLEVGAGDGSLIARMRAAGLDAWGIDPSPAACAAAARIGVEVRNAGIVEAEIETASQDGVVLWHSLEHLDDPAAAMRRVAGWTRPGGRLLVAVPNLAGLQARIGGDRWFHQDVPRHRTHFTPAGLRALLERCGYVVDGIHHLLVEQNPLGMWQTLLNRLTVERDFAFRLIKGDLAGTDDRARRRDLAISVVAGSGLAPVAIALELGAGLLGRGGSMVVAARTAR
jgi:SAM-dependent methyltransferase